MMGPVTDAFTYTAPVRYLEVDQQGVVFNMWYLAYMDEAFGAFLTRNGMSFDDMIAAGVDVQLVHTELDWSGSLRWGDDVAVEVELIELGRTSFTMEFRVSSRAGAPPVLVGRTVYVVISTDGSGKREPPADFRAALGDVR